MAPLSIDPQPESLPPEILSVRRRFFDRILYPFLLLGLLAAVMGALKAGGDGQWGFALLYATGFLVFAVAGLNRRISLEARALALVLTVLLVAVSALLRVGLSASGPLLMLLACTATSFLLGRRAAFLVMLFCITALSTIGSLMVARIWQVPPQNLMTSFSGMQWSIMVVVFAMAAFGLVTLPRMFEQRLAQSLVQVRERAEELEAANLALSSEIEARRRVQKQVERLATIIDATSDMVSMSGSDLKIFFLNPAGHRMLGIPPEADPSTLRIQDLHPPWANEKIVSEAIPAATHTGVWEGETAIFGPEGQQIPVSQVIMGHLGPEGRLEYLSTIVRDISERKNAEAHLRQAQKMEAIGTLAGGVAHDFNNLLMGIQGRVSLIPLETEASPRQMEHLKAIESYVARGANLTRQLLGFARGGNFNIRPLDLNLLVQESAQLFGRTRKEIEIGIDPAADLPAVEADRGQLDQVLLNLFLNAAKAMPSGGRIALATAGIELSVPEAETLGLRAGRFVRLTVCDTGTGMDETTRQRIFEPFFTTQAMGKGTGLGLAMVYGIISSHGGAVTVESEPGQGACFTIYLPASDRKPESEVTRSERMQPGSETILLVDDEEMIRDVGRQMLESMGYRVDTAASGEEALEILSAAKETIQLVILDLIMPGMGGAEAFKRIQELSPDTGVLISSGYSIDGQAAELLRRGADGFIQKPFRIQELSATVRQVLDAP